ncbi:unnamed protein product [Paramecium octaurelia]|uniref:Uncharacterized protein n=1 Tax=Paramecium octaurelia TaxID=43137 RepID=A0A8S1Y0Y8_PAROT|nr:unnamed protein product [Paramecium octaurelia]
MQKCFGSSNDHCTQQKFHLNIWLISKLIIADKVQKKGDACDCQEVYYFNDSGFNSNLCHQKCYNLFLII